MSKKCYTCMRSQAGCMCPYINKIKTQTKIVILIHPMEFKKEKNGTGVLTHLQLEGARLITGVDFSENNEVNKLIKNPQNQCFILYPGQGSLDISKSETKWKDRAKNQVIFIIDGTWPCAKKMLKLSQNLHQLPKISFVVDKGSQFLLKQQPHPLCLSTIESTHKLLQLLVEREEEQVDLTHFLDPFEKMIAFQIDCIENPPHSSYRSKGRKKLATKDKYKLLGARKLFFE